VDDVTDGYAVLRALSDPDLSGDAVPCLRLQRVKSGVFAALRADVRRLCEDQQPSSVTSSGHVTGWTGPYGTVTQYSLLTATGRYDDFSLDHDSSHHGKRFWHAGHYPTLARLLGVVPHCINARLNVLGPSSGLSPHRETTLRYTEGGGVAVRGRFHLPLETSPEATLTLGGDVIHLESGVVYAVNNGFVHSAENPSGSPRVHLVWDCLLTHDVYRALFGGGGPAPDIFDPVAPADRACAPVRSVAPTTFRALPLRVSARDARRVALCDPR
jgi:hypothetical protein